MERQRISSDTERESRVGYSRAVRAGSQVYVSGTTATDDEGEVVGEDDPAAQTRRALANVEDALNATGASLSDVVRTRLFVVDVDVWKAVGDAHAAYVDDVRPATSMVEVSRLIKPELLVEVEAVAVVDG